MLVLSRYRDESIYIGDDVVITVVDIRGDRVRIGVQAPPNVTVHRQEVYDAIKNGLPRDTGESRKADTPAPRPAVAPLGPEVNKRKEKKSEESKGLPVDVSPTVEFVGLTTNNTIPR
jgi:carbon storage regulator